jgi:hypothetical protein
MSIATAERPQHLRHLDLANRVRLERARRKRRIAAQPTPVGTQIVSETIGEPPDCMHTMTVLALLKTIHRFGHSRAVRVLWHAGVSESATLERLTARQRLALCEQLHVFA